MTVGSVRTNKKIGKYKMEVDELVWCCVHCRDLSSEGNPTTLNKIQGHLVNNHSIAKPIINQDYYENLGAAPAHSTFRCLFEKFNVHGTGPLIDYDSDLDL